MTRKRKSDVLTTAQSRLDALRYLNPTLDLGNGISMQNFSSLTEELRAKLTAYNAMVDLFDERREEIEKLEAKLKPKSERMLSAVASIYGKDSEEYRMAGGTKRESKKADQNPSEDELLNPEGAAMPNLLLNVTESEAKTGGKNGRGH